MSNKIGKTIATRIEWGHWIGASVDTNGDRICGVLDGTSGLTKAQWLAWMTGQRDQLLDVTDTLKEAELSLANERADDAIHRRERDERAHELYKATMRTRSAFDSVSDDLAGRFGLDGSVPQLPKHLATYVGNALEALRNCNETFGGNLVTVDPAQIARTLEPLHQKLVDKLDDLTDEEREAEALLVEREKVLKEWQRTYSSVASMLQGAYQLAGEDELADRVRPTVQRARGAEPLDEDRPATDEDGADTDADHDDEPDPIQA